MQGRVGPTSEVFGRDSELTAPRGLVAADRRVGAVLLTGAAGIGKTALGEAGLEMARAAGRFVLAARPAGTEAGMAFAGLIDLCDPVGPEVLAGLPAPQRSALEVALLRVKPLRGAAPGPHAIALADHGWLPGGPAGMTQRGLEWVMYSAAGLLSGAAAPMSIPNAIRGAAPRPELIIAGGAVPDEPVAARWFQAAAPASVRVWVAPGAGHTAALATDPAGWEARVIAFLDDALHPAGG